VQVYLSTSKYAASVFACIEMGRGAEPTVHLLAAYPAIECGTASAQHITRELPPRDRI
jgi:hypothetical protein